MENKIEICEHKWEEVDRVKRVAGYQQPGFLSDGMIWYEWRLVQRCKKCGKYNVVVV